MAYKVIILYQLYMPSYFLGTFTEYPELCLTKIACNFISNYMLFDRFWEAIKKTPVSGSLVI